MDGPITVNEPVVFENKEVIVKAGTTITIKTEVEHALHIKKGVLKVNGTAEKPVLIVSDHKGEQEKEDINAIFLENSEAHISHAHFRNNGWALHVHFSDLLVKNCLFEKNYGGIRLTGGNNNIRQNVFSDNDIAIRFLNSSPNITNNIFFGNKRAIFIREGVESAFIEKNGFYKNGYDFYTGFFQPKDILAVNNFFANEPSIFDAKKDPALKATVNTNPLLKTFPDWH
ncbi:MAG: hypothetical protein OHK0040_04290 [bacterium]